MERREKTVGIIGLGLIGGSIALRLKQVGFADLIIGLDTDSQHVDTAIARSIIDYEVTIDKLLDQSDIVVLAIPVDQAVRILPAILDSLNNASVVFDVGSTKEKICRAVNAHPLRKQYVSCHPIAGTEDSGPESANYGLFIDKVNIICDREHSSEQALSLISSLMQHLGMRVKFMDSKAHDRHIAYVSHLSHISSFVLGQTVLEVEKDEKNIFDMAGSGFESTVRLAKSSPEMWAPIFCENAENITEVLDAYIDNLIDMKEQIRNRNTDGLQDKMQQVNRIRKVLQGESLNVKI